MTKKKSDAPAEVETITLTMSRPVAEAVQTACEWYLRLHMGQFWDLAEGLCFAKFYSDLKNGAFKTKEQEDNAFKVAMDRRDFMCVGMEQAYNRFVLPAPISDVMRVPYRAEQVQACRSRTFPCWQTCRRPSRTWWNCRPSAEAAPLTETPAALAAAGAQATSAPTPAAPATPTSMHRTSQSKIKEFENIPDISVDGGETLEEAVADCRALFEKYNKEMYDGSVSLAQCAEARMVLLVLAHRSHHTIEFSTACLKAELLPTSTGPNLDNLAPMVGVERMAAGKATAVVRFTLSAARASATSIPEGTQVRTGEKQYFKTTKYAEIPAGQLTVDVEVVADEAGSGSDGILIGEINTLVDPIPYVDSVSNTSASTGGTDEEGDDSFTRRIHYAPSIFSIAGPADAYEYFAESWRTDVSGTKIICEEGYTIHIYFLMDGGRLPTEEECRGMESYFTTVKKPMGDLVLCHAPQEVPYDINLTYYIASSNTKNAVTIQENVEKAVQAYETWQRKIGRDIDPAELIMRVREAGAKRPKLTGPVDTKVTETQVAKLNSKKITYGGIEDD